MTASKMPETVAETDEMNLAADAAEQEGSGFGRVADDVEPAAELDAEMDMGEGSLSTDTMWDPAYFARPSFATLCPKFQALVVGIVPTTKNQGKARAYRFGLKNIKVLEGDKDAPLKIKNHFLDYNYKVEGGKCGWTYGLQAARDAGARTAKDIVGKVCIFELRYADYDNDTLTITKPKAKNERSFIVPMMVITSIEGLG
jgi:hypothetical protein